jgi:hypothetical protein
LVVATCANPNFGDSISVYGLGNGCTLFDVALDELTFAAVQAFNPFDLTFNMVNFGSVPVYSIDVELPSITKAQFKLHLHSTRFLPAKPHR